MTNKIVSAFESTHSDREVVSILLANGIGADGVYIVTAPLKNSDNPYEPCDFLYSINTGKAKIIVPTDDIDAYSTLMSNATEVWSK